MLRVTPFWRVKGHTVLAFKGHTVLACKGHTRLAFKGYTVSRLRWAPLVMYLAPWGMQAPSGMRWAPLRMSWALLVMYWAPLGTCWAHCGFVLAALGGDALGLCLTP